MTVLAALALLLRMLMPAGAMPQPALVPLTELLSGGSIRHGNPDAPAKPGDANCPLCLAPLPALAAAAGPLPSAPAAVPAIRLWRPAATAPPALPDRLAQPRGPPAPPAIASAAAHSRPGGRAPPSVVVVATDHAPTVPAPRIGARPRPAAIACTAALVVADALGRQVTRMAPPDASSSTSASRCPPPPGGEAARSGWSASPATSGPAGAPAPFAYAAAIPRLGALADRSHRCSIGHTEDNSLSLQKLISPLPDLLRRAYGVEVAILRDRTASRSCCRCAQRDKAVTTGAL